MRFLDPIQEVGAWVLFLDVRGVDVLDVLPDLRRVGAHIAVGGSMREIAGMNNLVARRVNSRLVDPTWSW